MPHTTEIWIKGLLCLGALAVVVWRHRQRGRLGERSGQLLAFTAVVAVAAYYNFGLFHGAGYVHHWEMFHYYLGSKYFPELGYDGLYVASTAAQAESSPELPLQTQIRDLRTNTVVPTWAVADHRAEVRQRFSPQRWQDFKRDNLHFVLANDLGYLTKIRLDHGYNPTPTWTFMGRLFDRFVPATRTALMALGVLDPLLLAVMFFVVFRTMGSRVGCLCLIVFGLGYPWRFDWVGGAFLRQDWLVAVVLAICMVRQKRWASAGALSGYAATVRLFPLLFLFGLGVLLLRSVLRRESLGWALRFAAGLAVSVTLCVGAGCLAGRGPGAWPEFVRNIEKHEGSWLTNNVGLKNLFLYGPDTISRRMVSWSLPEPWAVWQAHMDTVSEARRLPIAAVTLGFLAVLACAAWNAPRHEAALLGVAVVFAVLLLTCYYWVMLLVVPMRRGWTATAGWLAINVALFGLDLLTPAFEAIYGFMSWALAIFFLVWISRDALAVIRRRSAT